MRWTVSFGLLAFAAGVTAVIGLAAQPAWASGAASSFSITIGSPSTSHGYRGRHYRKHSHRPHRRRHRERFNIYNPYWPGPWAPTPRIVVVEPRRTITPAAPFEPPPYCREFQKQIVIDGRTERAYGVACLQPDGTWKIQP